MTSSLVDSLRSWLNGYGKESKGTGLRLQFTESGSGSERSARIDLESASSVGRVTVWDAGFCDVEAIGTAPGSELQYQHYENLDGARLDELLAEWVGRLGHQDLGNAYNGPGS
jgi:hypothetical protein